MKNKFTKTEKGLLSDIKRAKKLVDRNFNGADSDALCDAIVKASKALGKIITGLQPRGSDVR